MTWQTSGTGKVLVCLANCYDTMTDLQRDASVTRLSTIAGQSRELLPDFKITDGVTVDIDDINFIP